MGSFDNMARNLAAMSDLEGRIAALLDALADRIKATSNDQNVQKLSRDLKAARASLVTAVAAKVEP